jgi:plastocyanin/uncharacterized membrane protein
MENSMSQMNRPATSPSPVVFLLFLALLAVLVSNAAGQTPPKSPQNIIVIKQMHFDPPSLNVKAGDVVEWKNEDIFSHTVTASDGTFDSGLIAPGSSWQTTITKTGDIAYHCRPHPNMTAHLIVQPLVGAEQHEQAGAQSTETSQASLRWRPPTKPEEFHPILVDFTAALLPLAFLSDLLGRLFRKQGLHTAGLWMMVYEAIITPFTSIAGWWWRNSEAGQLPARLIVVHEWLGTAAAVLFILLAVWRWGFHKRTITPSWTYLIAVFIALLALVYQGSLGGAMVFGQ